MPDERQRRGEERDEAGGNVPLHIEGKRDRRRDREMEGHRGSLVVED
jgi:hypothetical protein